MAFKTSPGEDWNFQKYGVTNGGSSTSKIEGRDRTQDELLAHAASHPYPFGDRTRPLVRERLLELRERYHNPAWHRHLSQTKFERKEGEAVYEESEVFQSATPGD